MADISFQEEDQMLAPRAAAAPKAPGGLIGLVIKTGLAKDEKGANTVLIIVGVIAAVSAVAIFMLGGSSTPPEPVNVYVPAP